ncbi:hypothetical protein Cni_G14339 [Canna indica]|uniref:Nucleotide-diphospho-sugar transferase domain-containing protein n=1 Tax=Canna indica TaxID=4628 RepID=A0AAQ3QEN3_9LILI|nr:hypothetical protein Cni_G14339 [Canna indica]
MVFRRGFSTARCSLRLLLCFLLASALVYDCSWLPEMPIFSMLQYSCLQSYILCYSTPNCPLCACQKRTPPKDELQVQLEGASMENMTLIIGMLNKASVDDNGMLRLFLQSLREGENTEFLIKHILFLAADQTSYNYCNLLQLHCFQLYAEKARLSSCFGSASLSTDWTQARFLGEVLKRGYSFIFTDMDVMWLRNPFTRLKRNGEDMQLSRDVRDGHPLDDESNSINSGLFFVSSNEKTTALFTRPNSLMSNSRNIKEVDALHLMKSEALLRQLGIKVKYLDTAYFSSFCQDKLDITKLTTVHANCCPNTQSKFTDLKAILDVWKAYNGSSNLPARKSCTESWKASRKDTTFSLRGASMGNKILIISYLNKAYVEENGMLDLFLRSLKEGENTAFLIKHLFLITVDQIAFDRCKKLKLHCYQLAAEGLNFSKEQRYMSKGYVNLVWQKIVVLREVLRLGYNFIFTDMDVIWLRNPFAKLSLHEEDMQISCDRYNGMPYNDSNNINTGFFSVASNHRTMKLFDRWVESRKAMPGKNDQEVLAFLKNRGVFRLTGVRVRFLDTADFSGFCQVSKNSKEVTTMHANCCRSMKAKLDYLSASLEAWKRVNGTAAISWPKRVCSQSWRPA